MKKVFFVTVMVAMLAISVLSTGCRLVDRGSDDTPPVVSGVAFSLSGKLSDPSIKPNIAAGIKANVSIANDDLQAFVYKVKDGKKEKQNNGVGFPLESDGSFKCNFVGEEGYFLIQVESSVKPNFFMSIVIGDLTVDNATQSNLEIDATTTAVALLVEEEGFTVRTKEEISLFEAQNKAEIDANATIISDAAKETDGTIAVTEVKVNATASVNIGNTLTLNAAVVPSFASNKTIVWTIVSGDTFIGLDASTGVVTGKAEGKAVIKATAQGTAISSDIEIDVNVLAVVIPVASVSIAGKNSIEVGETATLTATISPPDATDQVVTWSGDDASLTIVKTGDKTATITGKAVTTTAVTVTATVGGQNTTLNVTVTPATIRPVTVDLGQTYSTNSTDYQIWVENFDAADLTGLVSTVVAAGTEREVVKDDGFSSATRYVMGFKLETGETLVAFDVSQVVFTGATIPSGSVIKVYTAAGAAKTTYTVP